MPAQEPAFELVRRELRSRVSEANWRLWLSRLAVRAYDGDELVLEAPANVRAWVADRFMGTLRAAVSTTLGAGVSVSLLEPGADLDAPARTTPEETLERSLNPRLSFDQFVIGEHNQLAHAAALAVAESPGLAYNPLFIYGPAGSGKTHLLQAVAAYARQHASFNVRYTTAEAFTNAFTRALRAGDADNFKAAFRTADILIVDDVGFFEGKPRTEEEFLHTFNSVYETGGQVICSCDRAPHELPDTDARLTARYGAGLAVALGDPDMPTRRTILRKRVDEDGLEGVHAGAIEEVAARVRTNIQTLEGALIRVVAFASLTSRRADADLAKEVLADLYPSPRRGAPTPTVESIQQAVAEALGVTPEALLSGSRIASVAWARQVAMYLTRELTTASLPQIGKAFGRNHTTVMHACRKTAARLEQDDEAQALVDNLTARLRG